MLLRSLVQLGKEYLGELWVRCLCITLASNEQTSKLMQMQAQAPLVLAVVCDHGPAAKGLGGRLLC